VDKRITKGYISLVKFDRRGYPSCELHGAMHCVNKERSIWRCPICHIGVSFDIIRVFERWLMLTELIVNQEDKLK